MINRGFAIHRIVGRLLIAGGLLIGSQAGFAQESAKDEAAPAAPEAAGPTPAEIQQGQYLFDGIVRLESGGPSCNSCHHVQNDAVVGGGRLAKELTTVFSRRGAKRVAAVLPHDGKESSSPVMRAAYQGKEFTESEVRALAAFLQNADQQSAQQKPSGDYAWRMFASGGGGLIAMLIFFGLVGHGRKKRSVNSDIYDRQIKSEGVR